jgi:hypothetical protein
MTTSTENDITENDIMDTKEVSTDMEDSCRDPAVLPLHRVRAGVLPLGRPRAVQTGRDRRTAASPSNAPQLPQPLRTRPLISPTMGSSSIGRMEFRYRLTSGSPLAPTYFENVSATAGVWQAVAPPAPPVIRPTPCLIWPQIASTNRARPRFFETPRTACWPGKRSARPIPQGFLPTPSDQRQYTRAS